MSPSTELRENREFAAEVKFLVPRSVAERIRHWARACLVPDPHGDGEFGDTYRISSIYFDTKQFDVLHRRGSYGRCKFRIRRYGDSETTFLERKLKTRGLVSKRRAVVPLSELARLGESVSDPAWRGRWFYQRLSLRRLHAVCQITYDRTARVTMGPHGPIRLTLDDNIVALPNSELAFRSNDQGVAVSSDQIIVEMKYRVEMPALLRRLVEDFALEPKAISKYRLAVGAMGLAPEQAAGVSTLPDVFPARLAGDLYA